MIHDKSKFRRKEQNIIAFSLAVKIRVNQI